MEKKEIVSFGVGTVVGVAGSVVLFNWWGKKPVNLLGRDMSEVKDFKGKSYNPPHRLVESCASDDEIIGIEEEEEQMPSASGVEIIDTEEELLPVELWLLLNDVNIGGTEPSTFEQEIVVINNNDLQKVNRCKWDHSNSSSNTSYFKVESQFFPVKPSMRGHLFRTVCNGSFIYLIGGCDYVHGWCFTQNHTYCIDTTNVFFQRTKEESPLHELSPMQNRIRTYPSVVTNGKRIFVFGGSEGHDIDVENSLLFGEIYDIKDDLWFPFKTLPFEDAARWGTRGCIMWDSEQMIVLFLEKLEEEEEEEEERGFVPVTTKTIRVFSYYDLREESWIDTVAIDVQLDHPILVATEGNIVYIVAYSSVHRYDLRLKRITGEMEGLKQMKEITGDQPLKEIVYLGRSTSSCHEGTQYFKFCIFWEWLSYQGAFLQFTIIDIGDDGGPKFTVRISSSVGRIPLKRDGHLMTYAHVMRSQLKEDTPPTYH